jgi:hypothetical protein
MSLRKESAKQQKQNKLQNENKMKLKSCLLEISEDSNRTFHCDFKLNGSRNGKNDRQKETQLNRRFPNVIC